MKDTGPGSRLERWLERRLGTDGEFLLGDLAEGRTRRRARAGRVRAALWYWGQLLGAGLRPADPARARQPAGPGRAGALRNGWRGLSLDLAVFARKLRRRPVWAATVVAVLALGIGANAAMFAGFDAWVTRPLPFAEPERLVALTECRLERDVRRQPVSPRNLGDWNAQQTSFESIDAFERAAFNLADAGEPVRVRGARVSHSLFRNLGVAPALGRPFRAEDERPGQPQAVALVSDRLWRERYAGRDDVVGTTIRLDGRVHEIVGVMPEGFRFPEWHDVWTPLGVETRAGRRDDRRLSVVARLAPGATLERARADLQGIAREIARTSPRTSAGWSVEVLPLRDVWVPPVIDVALTVSLLAGGLVLLVVCANIASLMLAEASARARETAIRSALGASRWRLARQSLVEGTSLAVAAAVAAVGVSVAWSDWMMTRAPTEPPYLFAMRLDARVLLYTLGIALVAGAAVALAPALRRSGRRLAADLTTGGRATSVAAARLRSVLVVGELALSTALVIGALLLVKSFHRQQSVDPGYRTASLYAMNLSLTGLGFEDAAARGRFLQRLEIELRGAAGIRRVGISDGLPAEGGHPLRLETPERPGERQRGERALRFAIGADYLETLEVPLVSGRRFTEAERRDGGDVALVGESLARALWGDGDAVGRSLRPASDEPGAGGPWLRVVGIVGDIHWPEDMVARGAVPVHQVYRPWPEVAGPWVDLVVESGAPPPAVAAAVRESVRRTGLVVPVSEVVTMEETIRRSQWVTRFFGEQLVVYALFALLIAAVGIYGLVADSVVQRRREIAVRLALGARPGDVRRAIVGGAVRLGAVGLAGGLIVGVGVAHLSRSMLGGVPAADPAVLASVVLLLTATLLAASIGPARRASNADPAQALRAE